MKTCFNTYDIICGVTELQKLAGLRLNQIYDIDNKTYLLRFQGGENKIVLLIESGVRFHTTSFDWPKNIAPSGFSMKLRKHLRNKRLEKIHQVGADRIVDFQFGVGEAAHHIILELYDRGNIILTDHELTILYVLRPHNEGEEARFAVREKYPTNRAKVEAPIPTQDDIIKHISSASSGDNLRRLLMPLLNCGPAVIDHVLLTHNLDACVITKSINDESTEQKELQIIASHHNKNKKKKKALQNDLTRPFDVKRDIDSLMLAIQDANEILIRARKEICNGYIIQKQEKKPSENEEDNEYFYQNIEYHPNLFNQCAGRPHTTYDSFLLAVDEFYSQLECQKIDFKTLLQERDALKKLSNVKNDHTKRLDDLTKAQEGDKLKAELITSNQDLVDNAILGIRSALANQMSWVDIQELVKAAQSNGDQVALSIKQLKLEINHISLNLSDPFSSTESEEGTDRSDFCRIVDCDLALSAWGNARKYYDLKRTAALKEQKTIEASQKALKSAEKKTHQTLQDVRTISTISKARKVYWFEKFYWFISSENYLVIGGRDAQQNELIVKRYMRLSDIYVHAEIQGAASVLIRNPNGGEIPPKTLLEAGTMAISYSVAWDAKVITNAYWVHSDQVSKTAPTGEYLGTGSFMVRGKKNFLPSCHLIMGLSLLFKLEDSFIDKHRNDRKVRQFNEVNMEEQLHHETMNQICEPPDQCHGTYIDIESDKRIQTINNTALNVSVENFNLVDDINSSKFPDTQVNVEHDSGRITIKSDTIIENTVDNIAKHLENMLVSNIDEETLIPAAPSRRKQQQNSKKRKELKDKKMRTCIENPTQVEDEQQYNNSQLKRGHKAKIKKIKTKYMDQDEEERLMRMNILKSSGRERKELTTSKMNESSTLFTKNTNTPSETKKPITLGMDDVDDIPSGADVAMLDSLTGQPFDDDELLFAIPVVAPYQALQNYKYRVKLTPGTGKRGRAAKMALVMFSKEKHCRGREKDLLKSIKDESLARNIPGKVKLSAPQLQKFKK